jgi:hypothetical protein
MKVGKLHDIQGLAVGFVELNFLVQEVKVIVIFEVFGLVFK